MKLKKMFIGISILNMILSPLPSFASGTLSGIGLLANEEGSDDPDIYQVTLPTGDDLGIILDPEGLISISEKGEYDSSWAGMVHMKENGGALFINKSSFPVSITIGLSIDQDMKGTPSSIILLDSADYVDEGGWPQMYLEAIPGASKIHDMDAFEPSDIGIPILANENQGMITFSFLLEGADYILDEETGEYTLADYEDNYDSASFILDGRVNQNADWSAYIGASREPIIIHAVYTIQRQKVYDKEELYSTSEDVRIPHALMKAND